MVMKAKIYQPSRSAMQSGMACTRNWLLEFPRTTKIKIDPLMGWASSGDTKVQVRIPFETKDAAIAYAEENGIDYSVQEPTRRKPIIRKRGYAENFAHERRDGWTH